MIEKEQQKPDLNRKWNKKVFGKNLGKGPGNTEIQEHAKLVEEFKSQYGSLRKPSIATNVQWATFHRLCRPVQHKIKARRQIWVDI